MKHLGAGILYTDGKKILLLHRSKDVKAHPLTWAPTGGGSEGDEDFLQTAERESKEEIGVFKGRKIVGFETDPFVMYIYKVNKLFDVKLNNEHLEAKWIDLDKVDNYELHPNFKKEWPKYLRAIKKNNRSFREWLSRVSSFAL